MISLLAVCTGFVLDIFFGDPVYWFHPIRLIGSLISKTEKGLRFLFYGTPGREIIGGAILTICVAGISTVLPCMMLALAYAFHPFAGYILESLFCYQLLAMKSLRTESMKVYDATVNQGLLEARRAVSFIVGRDTENLSKEGVLKATVETVAENTSDGVIAPLFYMLIGGAGLGFFYKAVNTLDSMVGYKNHKYLYFGRASARLDDIVNYIPARLAGYCMIISSSFFGFSKKDAWRIYRRDSKKHASPNSAKTEAACAGALGLELAGDAVYFGKVHHKPVIGDKKREIEEQDIIRANQLLYGTSILFLVLFGLLRLGILLLGNR